MWVIKILEGLKKILAKIALNKNENVIGNNVKNRSRETNILSGNNQSTENGNINNNYYINRSLVMIGIGLIVFFLYKTTAEQPVHNLIIKPQIENKNEQISNTNEVAKEQKNNKKTLNKLETLSENKIKNNKNKQEILENFKKFREEFIDFENDKIEIKFINLYQEIKSNFNKDEEVINSLQSFEEKLPLNKKSKARLSPISFNAPKKIIDWKEKLKVLNENGSFQNLIDTMDNNLKKD